MTTESIKTKIAALLAKAESTNNSFEADAFMAKVNELLEKHQIEMHEVRQTQKTETDPMGHQSGETNIYASILWARDLAPSLAQYYGCRFVWWRRGNHFKYEILGRESARVTFELMFSFIISQVKVQAKRTRAEKLDWNHSVSIWEREIGQALWVRILDLVKVRNAHRSELISKALVPVDDVTAYVNQRFGDLKKGKPKQLNYTGAAKAAAERVSLRVQATGRHVKLLA